MINIGAYSKSKALQQTSECGLRGDCGGIVDKEEITYLKEPKEDYAHLLPCIDMDVSQFTSSNMINFGKEILFFYDYQLMKFGQPKILSEAEDYQLIYKEDYSFQPAVDENGSSFNSTKFMTQEHNPYSSFCASNETYGFWFKLCNPGGPITITVIN
ncbi:hypothetical protein SNEBB_008023 [Seison nebaliae]|nr:hypothetical protein SNEBB_008023 [Seison nebaliae]